MIYLLQKCDPPKAKVPPLYIREVENYLRLLRTIINLAKEEISIRLVENGQLKTQLNNIDNSRVTIKFLESNVCIRTLE